MKLQEDYCSYEVSKLLKEKGFDEPCRCAYWLDGRVSVEAFCRYTNSRLLDERYARPTLQMAMKWLREKGIECVVYANWEERGRNYRSYVILDKGDHYVSTDYDSRYSTYEEAAESAIKYSLENLI